MARAKQVTARKNYPAHGIKKGEKYWWWKFRHGPKHYSKTPPKPSQLTQSEFYSAVYSLQEDMAEWKPAGFGELAGMIDDAINTIDEIKSECEDKLNNLPDQLQNGQPGELQQERIDALEEWSNGLTELKDKCEGMDIDKPEETVEDVLQEVQGLDCSV